MSITDRLDEVQARSDQAIALIHQYVETGGEAYEVIVADRILQAARTDVPRLVAALRAVPNLEAEYALAAESGDPGHVRAADVANYIRRAVEAALGEVDQ